MVLVNRFTGKGPTKQEWEQCRAEAIKILQNPYSSPEQVEWALGFVDDPVQYMLRPMQEKRLKAAQADGQAGR